MVRVFPSQKEGFFFVKKKNPQQPQGVRTCVTSQVKICDITWKNKSLVRYVKTGKKNINNKCANGAKNKKEKNMKMFAIRDEKAEGYNTPFFQQTYGLAERSFKDACKDEQTALFKNKEDFSLWYLGEFDQNTGELIPEKPKEICKAPIEI